MEFIRKLLKMDRAKEAEPARGTAPIQSQENQDATRARMEAEMAEQRERRDGKPSE